MAFRRQKKRNGEKKAFRLFFPLAANARLTRVATDITHASGGAAGGAAYAPGFSDKHSSTVLCKN